MAALRANMVNRKIMRVHHETVPQLTLRMFREQTLHESDESGEVKQFRGGSGVKIPKFRLNLDRFHRYEVQKLTDLFHFGTDLLVASGRLC
jgi:hypothetical protein